MAPYLVGVSLKMYFSHARTLAWCSAVAEVARAHPAVRDGAAELFVIPSYLSVTAAVDLLRGVAAVGAQDLAMEDEGAFTGEVSGAEIAEVGCRVVEVGHAERRRLFGETDAVVRAKTDAALRNGLAPVLCVGEAERGDPESVAQECVRQVDDALSSARAAGRNGHVIVAYEPLWAIGADSPAEPDYIRSVCAHLRRHLDSSPDFAGSRVIYGGSARPGLLGEIADDVDGLFLGRFAHRAESLEEVLDEVLSTRAALQAAGGR
ncbi:triose-phosphate isomerase family protein [Sinomonas terrae]|uniref:Triosephosphate isomerase n=1 Tax=Sinomonas terrae TaxID=2908838 RepID=A0ABS9TZE9_9MICC|nr:triose-phosphate isomerase family protein [Sinomonas terrae]MCH6469801.1 triose-phosphate isomerase [Sinomonas terrae]